MPSMVSYFGMSPQLPNISFFDSSGQSDYSLSKPYSDKTAELIDAEVKRIISEQFARAKQILDENKEGHHKLAELLIEKEVILADDLVAIFGERKWKSRQDELIEANNQAEKVAETPKIESGEEATQPAATSEEKEEI